jgi:hypothetical protein
MTILAVQSDIEPPVPPSILYQLAPAINRAAFLSTSARLPSESRPPAVPAIRYRLASATNP